MSLCKILNWYPCIMHNSLEHNAALLYEDDIIPRSQYDACIWIFRKKMYEYPYRLLQIKHRGISRWRFLKINFALKNVTVSSFPLTIKFKSFAGWIMWMFLKIQNLITTKSINRTQEHNLTRIYFATLNKVSKDTS